MILRPASAGDVVAVHAIEVALFGLDAWSEASVREELTGDRRVVVAGDPSVVGYAVSTVAGDVVDLLRVGIAPSHRRRGLAGSLLAAVLDDADRVLLEVGETNHGALAFYAAEGFVEIDRRRSYYRDGTDAVVMERPPRTAE